MIEHRHVIFVLAVVKVAKRDVTAVRSFTKYYYAMQLVLDWNSYFESHIFTSGVGLG